MKTILTKPLGLRKKPWEGISDYKCVAILDSTKDNIKRAVIDKAAHLFSIHSVAFAIIWFWDGGASLDYYRKKLASITLVSNRDDYLLYEIKSVLDIENLISIWGDCDDLNIIFPQNADTWRSITKETFYKSYNKYCNDVISRITSSNAIVSDTGDGEEAEFIVSNALFEKVFC